ncbi:MAG: protein translocase subunit SecF [Acidobacteriota bacterium]
MNIVQDPKVDWLGFKWVFIAVSGVLLVLGTVSLLTKGLNLGVDFTGGTLVYVKFKETPQLENIRQILRDSGLKAEQVTRFDDPAKNEVQIRMARIESEQSQDLNQQSRQVLASLRRYYDRDYGGTTKLNLNEFSSASLSEKLQQLDVEAVSDQRRLSQHYDPIARRIIDYRDRLGDALLADPTPQQVDLSEEMKAALRQHFYLGKLDLNNLSKAILARRLRRIDPDKVGVEKPGQEAASYYEQLAGRLIDLRTRQGGVLRHMADLDPLHLSEAVQAALENDFYVGSFNLISVESVGPKVGRELQGRAQAAVISSLFGMLVYIAFRFRPIYGLAAIATLFHDVLITLGLFSISNKEISLTVVAALLTLVGYSINDTIVVFDRVRENLKLMRRKDLTTIFNLSINQTLNRTILTSGMTFLAVFSLYLLGGQVLNGFSFGLVVGIIIGTYSSVAIASPIVLWWQNYAEARKARS